MGVTAERSVHRLTDGASHLSPFFSPSNIRQLGDEILHHRLFHRREGQGHTTRIAAIPTRTVISPLTTPSAEPRR